MTRTQCPLPDRRIQPWREQPDYVNHLQLEPPSGLPEAEVKHPRQGGRLKANISRSQGVLLHLEPNKK